MYLVWHAAEGMHVLWKAVFALMCLEGYGDRVLNCDTPQILIDGSIAQCDLCFSCCKAKEDEDRRRRLYWLKRKRGSYVEKA